MGGGRLYAAAQRSSQLALLILLDCLATVGQPLNSMVRIFVLWYIIELTNRRFVQV